MSTSNSNRNAPISENEERIAEQFVSARLQARPLVGYPGVELTDFPSAYRCQDAAIARWPEPIGGWKVTKKFKPEWHAQYGTDHLIGPVFLSSIRHCATQQVVECPVIAGGMCGVESEIVIRVARDAPPDKFTWTIDEASDMVGEFCVGVEIVSSPLTEFLPHLGLPTLASDFGLNFGIVVGSPVSDWRNLNDITAETYIDEKLIRRGTVSLRDGPLAGLAFVLANCALRGYPLAAGAVITTGTITDYHSCLPGQSSRHVFEGLGEVRCRQVEAKPFSRTESMMRE